MKLWWKEPSEGDSRTVRRFAWLPTIMSDGTVVWLELYGSSETYGYSGGWDGFWRWSTDEKVGRS